MNFLFIGGDVGSARALQPVADELRSRGHRVCAVDQGFWHITGYGDMDLSTAVDMAKKGLFDGCAMGTSVKDTDPLALGRACRSGDVPVFCMLESWVNYRRRLEIDGKGLFLPDIYGVVDDDAREDALSEGIPEGIIKVVGHPGFAGLVPSSPLPRDDDGRMTVVFASEPVEMDQGTDRSSPDYRGYTEKTVFTLFCRALQPYCGDVKVMVAPHPREDRGALISMWDQHRGGLLGEVVRPGEGRELAFSSSAVAGMASILLYECWLMGIPALSLQPGMVRKDLAYITRPEGIFFSTTEQDVPQSVGLWVEEAAKGRGPIRPELERHRSASSLCSDIIQSMRG